MKMKVKKTVKIHASVEEAAERFNAAFEDMKTVLINRETEIEALKLAVIAKHNIMLDGPPGIAKSALADAMFRRITGASTFHLQLMKGTQADQLFGPIFSERYRKDAVWEHNTDRMLPKAHFAFLDEVYRASDMLLPAVLGILNEREFINGPVTMRCPLMTAIGTTNFVTNSDELEAFHDRWLIRIMVKPLDSASLRLRLMHMVNDRTSDNDEDPVTVSLADIQLLQQAAKRRKLGSDTIDLYEEVYSGFKTRAGNGKLYISDRRMVQTLSLMKAAAVLADPDAEESTEVSPEYLSATQYGLTKVGDKDHDSWYTSSLEQSQASFEAYRNETELVRSAQGALTQWLNRYDESMPKDAARKLLFTVKQVVEGMASMPEDRKPKNAGNAQAFENTIKKMEALAVDLETLIK